MPIWASPSQETEPWKGEVKNLPEFDSSGHQYEYYLLEEGDGVSRFPIYETERTEDGGYQTRVINVPTGAGNRIMVRKVWIDDSDTTHRLPVTIQAYAKEDNKAISSVTLRDGVWYGYIGIGSYTADEVYILETQVGDEPRPADHLLSGQRRLPQLHPARGSGGIRSRRHLYRHSV